MKFICTNKGRFSVHNGGIFAEFVNGEFETDNASWLDVLKNVQGVQVVEGAAETTQAVESAPVEEPAPVVVVEPKPIVKKKPGHPTKKNKK